MITLAQARQARGLSGRGLAALAGVDMSAISRIERGLYKPGRSVQTRLANALGVKCSDIRELQLEDTCSPSLAASIARLMLSAHGSRQLARLMGGV